MIQMGSMFLGATLIGGGQGVSPFFAHSATFLSIVAAVAGITVFGSFVITRVARFLL